MVRPMIICPERSRSLWSEDGVSAIREAAMVRTKPLTSGCARRASVQSAATAMAPAPMKRTCVVHTCITWASSAALGSG